MGLLGLVQGCFLAILVINRRCVPPARRRVFASERAPDRGGLQHTRAVYIRYIEYSAFESESLDVRRYVVIRE